MEHSKFEESMKAFLFVKPGKETHNLDDYVKNISILRKSVRMEFRLFYKFWDTILKHILKDY